MYDGPYREVRDPRWAKDAEVQEWRDSTQAAEVDVAAENAASAAAPGILNRMLNRS
jgi:hypothetical protein